MPSLDVAMARSLGETSLEQLRSALARRIAAGIDKRDVLTGAADTLFDAKTAFSSWDNCMKVNYCKWPVIAVIVVGGLILLSIVSCIIRRLCCGLACCCSCFQCLKCCGNCCGCCDTPSKQKHKYLEEPYIPPNHGYQMQPPMHAPSAAHTQQKFEPPQYAEFDVPKKGGEDSLPQMPSWESGNSKKIEVEEEEVEMDHLKQSSTPKPPMSTAPPSRMGADARSLYSAPGAGSHGYAPGQPLRSQTPGYGRSTPAHAVSPPLDQRGYNNYSPDHEHNSYGFDQVNAPFAAPVAHGRQMSHASQGFAEMPAEPAYPGYHDQRSLAGSPAPYGVRRQMSGDGAGGMDARPPYGMDSRVRNSPGPRQTPVSRGDYQYMPPRASPAPREPGYRQPGFAPSPAPVNAAYPTHQPPHAGWSSQQSHPGSPQPYITNSAGFDFTSGYSRPNDPSHQQSGAQSPTKEAYPGYKPYTPA
ncbi:hypothetical protein HIM_07008 [Hirsutella minnesotensis 3608]|uniref:Fibroin-3 n=1 Tax=Hirsutella minnesotensis 3608 TaxID=1043627 RepID=A0A0F7ZNF8_9HYPO|nr:hypothetical protein HIM_07008 [Hirsutella minnesotensis 3608]